MKTIEQYANTYGLPVETTKHFLDLPPGEATRVLNSLAGNNVATTLAELKKQMDIIQSEVNEGHTNLAAGEIAKMRDDAMDIVFTAFGLANRLGAPADLDYKDVVLSNLCKFDTTVGDQIRTRDKYLALNVVTTMVAANYQGVDYYVTKVAYDQQGLDGKHYPAGKWLKSHRWVDCQYQGDLLTPCVVPVTHTHTPGDLQPLKAELADTADDLVTLNAQIESESMVSPAPQAHDSSDSSSSSSID